MTENPNNEILLSRWLHSQERVEQLQGENDYLKSLLAEYESALDSSISYRIGRALTYLPRKIVALKQGLCQIIFKAGQKKRQTADIRKQMGRNEKARTFLKKEMCIIAYEDFHASVVHSVIQISNYHVNSVEVITIEPIHKELLNYLGEDEKKINWVIIPESEDKGKNKELHLVVSGLVSKSKRQGMIIIPSIEYCCEEYAPLLLKPPKNAEIVAMIHNLNRCFCSCDNDPRFHDLINRASSYAVLDKLLIDEINRRHLTDRKVYEFPVVFRGVQEKSDGNNDDRTTFVVTGSVEKERKDFDLVMDTFSDLYEYYAQLRLVLLGKAITHYGKYIVDRCKDMQNNGLTVQFYESFVPTDQFQQVMLQADYLLAPVNVHYTGGGLDEIYGVTKMTGVITDMIEYSKPAIAPYNLQMPVRLASSTIHYHTSEDLKDVIISLLDRETTGKLTAYALENSHKYALADYLL